MVEFSILHANLPVLDNLDLQNELETEDENLEDENSEPQNHLFGESIIDSAPQNLVTGILRAGAGVWSGSWSLPSSSSSSASSGSGKGLF